MAYIGKAPFGNAVRTRFFYTASGGETSLSGADSNGKTLAFTDGNYVDVYLNGVLLITGTDYNTSTENTIAGLSALAAGDNVEIVVYETFSLFNSTFNGNVTINEDLTVDTNTLYVDSTNNRVGIGTTSPATALDVNGTVTADSATFTGVVNINATTGYGNLEMGGPSGAFIDLKSPSSDDYDARIIYNGSNLFITTNQDQPVILQHNNANKLTTASTGIDVTGTVTADGLTVDGTASMASTNELQFFSSAYGIRASTGLEIKTGDFTRFLQGTTERMRIDSSGNVGIGTSSVFSPLHLGSGEAAPSTSGNMANNGLTISNGVGGRAIQVGVDDTAQGAYIQSGYVNNSNVANNLFFYSGASRSMTIDSSGNVGIGTTAPVSPLEIATTNKLGATFTGTTNGEGLTVTQTNYTAGNYISLVEAAYDDSNDANPNVRIGAMFDGNGSNLAFGTSNSYGSGITNTAMFINSSGNVGIGTSSPNGNLDVSSGNNSNSGYVDLYIGGTDSSNARSGIIRKNTSSPYDMTIKASNYSGGNDLIFDTGAGEKMRINSSGNVGIGLTPTAKLHVAGTIQSQIGSSVAQMYTDGGAAYFSSVGAYPSLFLTNGSERMRINAAGRVDINDSLLIYNNLEVGAGAGTHGKINSQTPGTFEYFIDKGLSYRGVCDGSFGGYLLLVPAYTSGTVVGKKFYGEIIADRGNTGNGNSTSWAKVLASTAYNSDKLLLKVMGSSQYFTATHKVTYNGTQYLALRFNVSGGGPVNSFHAKGHVRGEDSNFLFMARDSEVSNVISFGTRILDI